ncbi:MAG: hypothetical protein FJ202_09395, partial [Gemmatimonadetes bacterium]|nr:hypothetical protein [Gemmatimonadota bacterium]
MIAARPMPILAPMDMPGSAVGICECRAVPPAMNRLLNWVQPSCRYSTAPARAAKGTTVAYPESARHGHRDGGRRAAGRSDLCPGRSRPAHPSPRSVTMPRHVSLGLATVALAANALTASAVAQSQDPAIMARAKAIHDRVIKLDTHVDFSPANMSDTPPNYVTGLRTQVDMPKMKAGFNGIFFSIYTGAGPLTPEGYEAAWKANVDKFEAVHKLATRMAPEQIEIARTAADVRRIVKAGKLVALMGVENGLGVGTDITRVKKMADYGARYISLVHNGHNQLSDSNTGEASGQWMHNGVSELGKQVVAEANKYGILLDISHPSKASNMWVMANSKAPVIASHSSVRALCQSASRDLDDEQLQALKKNGGVMQTTAFASYVNCTPAPSAERVAALAALASEFGLEPAVVGRAGGPGGGGGGGGG